MAGSVLVGLGSWFLASKLYYPEPVASLANIPKGALSFIYRGALNKWWIDELYNAVIIQPIKVVSDRLLRAIDAVERAEASAQGDERTALEILKRALEAPTRQIAENSGVNAGVVVARMREGSGNFGFDAAHRTYVDLVGVGILDATKVLRIGLENAVSAASVLLLTEATMTEVREESKELQPAME